MLEVNATISSDSFENFHTYEVDWTPDVLTWYVDGVSVRTLERNTTYNSTTNSYWYPQSPSRVELSVWPGGSPSEPQGTIDWAGGEIQWDTADIKDPGYYYATIGEISITCYDPPTGANVQGNKSYIYADAAGTNNTVEITDEDTVLASFEATGTNVTAGATTTSASQTSSSTGGSDNGSDSGSSGPSGSSSSGSSSSGFVQGVNSAGMSSSIAVNHPLAQSLLALVVTLLAF
jgi:beta-glucanase (GH16 family)